MIAAEMPDFYKGTYCLETTKKENADIPAFLKSYIIKIQEENENQGKYGTFFGRGIQPHITVKNILQQSSAIFSDELVYSAFMTSSATLLNRNQTIEVKMDAIELLVYLIKSQPMLLESNKQQIKELLTSKSQVESAKAIMTNLNETNLRFSALLLYHCLGEEVTVDLLNTLADIGDDALSNRKAGKAFSNYLEASTAPVRIYF